MKIKKINPIARSVGIFGAVAALATAATFAVAGGLSSTATLTNNTLESATANLFVSKSAAPSTNSESGYDISGVVPGGAASGPYAIHLGNGGSVDLGVTVFATNSVVTGTLDNNKVHFCFTRVSGPSTACYTYAEMLANFNDMPGGPLLSTDGDVLYNMTVSMDTGAVTGSGATIAPFNLVFTGTQQ